MQISNIDTTLNYGHLNTGKKQGSLYFSLVSMLLLPLLTILMLIIQVMWDSQMIFTMVVGDIMTLSFFAVFVYIIVKNNILKKKILLWLDDAVEIKAYSKKTDEYWLGLGIATKIQVKFVVADKTYIKESTAKTFGGRKGYLGCYSKYADREIRILYSPKYDEVLILKDK